MKLTPQIRSLILVIAAAAFVLSSTPANAGTSGRYTTSWVCTATYFRTIPKKPYIINQQFVYKVTEDGALSPEDAYCQWTYTDKNGTVWYIAELLTKPQITNFWVTQNY